MVVHCSLVFQDTTRRDDVEEGKNWDVAIFFMFFVFRHRVNEKCRDYGKTDFLSDHFHVYSVLTLIVVCYFMRKSAWNDDDCDSHVYLSSDDARVNYFSVDFFSLGCRPNGEKKMGKISLVCEMKWIKIPRQWCYFIPPQKACLWASSACVIKQPTKTIDNKWQQKKIVMKMFCWLGRLGWREFEKKMRLNSLSILRSSTTAEWFIIHKISTENQMSWRRILNIYGGVKRRYSNEFIEHILIFDYSWVSSTSSSPSTAAKKPYR